MLRAKPEQTLAGHLLDSFRVLKRLKNYRGSAWEQAVGRLGYNPQLSINLRSFAVYAHDLGKALQRWQQYLDTGRGRITHALFSMLLARDLLGPVLSRSPEGRAALLAVLAHHGLLHDAAFAGEGINGLGTQKVEPVQINEIIEIFNKAGNKLPLRPLTSSNYTGYAGAREVASLRRAVQEMEPEERLKFKGLYTLFLSVLQLCDNEASYQVSRSRCQAAQPCGPVVESDWPLHYGVSSRDAFNAFLISRAGLSPNELQEAVRASANPNLILQAGCGSGKTAAALHYGASLWQNGLADRLVITLPTRFTTNSIFWDFQLHYGLGQEHTGIYHGEMESVLLSGMSDGDIENDRHLKDMKFENSFFNRPVNVCTVDHLLYSLLHCHRYADRAFGNLMTAGVVFDEIHYYDTYTLKKIGQCMAVMRQLEVPHMVMSATIPRSVVDYLSREARWEGKSYHFIRQGQGCGSVEDKPFRIVKMNAPVIGSGGEVSGELLSLIDMHIHLRQMVVVNQVERAKAVARAISYSHRDKNVICYHSEFTRRDRDRKERLIKALFKSPGERGQAEVDLIHKLGYANHDQVILVSTQICELSLDISAGVMYSEIAPADSIAQRGGRLHRKGRHWQAGACGCPGCVNMHGQHEYCMYLFPLDWDDKKSLLPYKEGRDGLSLLKSSWEAIGDVYSFSAVTAWVDELYPEAPELTDSEMMDMIYEDAVFGRKPGERFGSEYGDQSSGSFRARHSDFATATVIPGIYMPDNDFDPVELVKEHGVRVPVYKLRRYLQNWLVKEHYKSKEKYVIHVLDLPYSFRDGFKFLKK